MNEERIKQLQQFIEDDPKDPFNKYALAMEFYQPDPQRALELLKNLEEDHPDYLPLYFKLAHLLWEKEQWEEAARVFKAGIKLAGQQEDKKALSELNAAYLNFQFDMD